MQKQFRKIFSEWVLLVVHVGLWISLSDASAAENRDEWTLRLLRVQQLINDEYQKDHRGGLTAGIVEGDKLVWIHSMGYADEQTQRISSADTVYPVASVTKIITGIMFLQLVEKGYVHLTDPVEKYVPEIKTAASKYPWTPPITLMQLATMSAGFATSACSAGNMRLVYEPGTKRLYSNQSYCLLGLALSKAAGKPYKEYVKENILMPLGMTSTQFADEIDQEEKLAIGYQLGLGENSGVFFNGADQEFALPAGGLVSTVGDLGRLMWFQMGYGPEVVLPREALLNSYELMLPSDTNLAYGDGIGYAAVRNTDASFVALGHGGSLPGYVASYEFDLETSCGVILLANSNHGKAEYKPLVRRILSLLHPSSRGGSGHPGLEEH